MYFFRPFWISLLLFVFCLAGFYIALGQYSKKDYLAYQKLLQADVEGYHLDDALPSKQQRIGLQKDIFINKGPEHLQMRLQSEHAELEFDRQDGGFEIVEHLSHVKCYLQEECFYQLKDGRESTLQDDGRLLIKGGNADHTDAMMSFDAGLVDAGLIVPMQRLVYFEMDAATYHYRENIFTAENVKINRYLVRKHVLEGIDLSLAEVLERGTARRLNFNLEKDAPFRQCKKIMLQDQVHIEHGLGALTADQVVVTTADAGKNLFDQFLIDGNVEIAFREGGKLSCAQADIDYIRLHGEFCGDDNKARVHYAKDLLGKKNETIPLLLQCKGMSIQLDKNSKKNEISEIKARDEVKVSYGEYTLLGDRADYVRASHAGGELSGLSFPGLITVHADCNRACQIVSQQGDKIKAQQISVDTIKREVSCLLPIGVLSEGKINQSIDFSAGSLTWYEEAGLLTLNDDVLVKQKAIGKLQAAKEVRLLHHVIDGRMALKAIETSGDAILISHSGAAVHTLKSSGPIKVDHQKMEARFFSLKDSDGKIAEDKQVSFKDAKGEIFADKVLIKYEEIDSVLVPAKIVLVGNVKILNRLASSVADATPVLQHLLAERVEFFPKTKEMIFTSKAGQRVLFYDKANNLEVSAPILKIVRDTATKKESIKGVGNVRFSFVEHELAQLTRRFSLGKKQK